MHRALTDEVFDHLQGSPLSRISQGLGISADETAQAVVAALPLLVGAYACAMRRDDAGEGHLVMDSLRTGAMDDQAVLPLLFGEQVTAAASGLGSATGLGRDRAHMLLAMLVSSVRGSLAQRMSGNGNGHGALRELLEHEYSRIDQRGGVGARLLACLVECDSDVDLADMHHLAPSYPGGAARPVL